MVQTRSIRCFRCIAVGFVHSYHPSNVRTIVTLTTTIVVTPRLIGAATWRDRVIVRTTVHRATNILRRRAPEARELAREQERFISERAPVFPCFKARVSFPGVLGTVFSLRRWQTVCVTQTHEIKRFSTSNRHHSTRLVWT